MFKSKKKNLNKQNIKEYYKPTTYFDNKKNIPLDEEYKAKCFPGLVKKIQREYSDKIMEINTANPRKIVQDMSVERIVKIFGISSSTINKALSYPFYSEADRAIPTDSRQPSMTVILAIAIAYQLSLTELNDLLDSAERAPLKRWRIGRGDDLILEYYDKIVEESKRINDEDINCFIKQLNDKLYDKGLPILFKGDKYDELME